MAMSASFGHDYLRLILHIEKHIDGFVDAYIGPPKLKAEVEQANKLSLTQLRDLWVALAEKVPNSPVSRQQFGQATIRALGCTLDLLEGQEVSYADEVRRLYDIELRPRPESSFLAAHNELDSALPGQASLSLNARLSEFNAKQALSPEMLTVAIDIAMTECRQRTAQFVDLRPGEDFRTEVVTNKPWSAYNWFLGDAKSLIEINTDLPTTPLRILGLICHEAYPGHHTEHQLKEAVLYHEMGYDEFGAAILHSPTAVIAEGIATTALEIIFPADTAYEWARDQLFAKVGIDVDIDEVKRVARAREALKYVSSNAAIRFHTGLDNEAQTIDYITTYGLSTEKAATKSFSFLSHPLYRSYVQTYTNGYDLIAEAAPTRKTDLFKTLLTEAWLPSKLAAMAPR